MDRFDANCYVALTRQMNSHDITRDRDGASVVLGALKVPALVIGVTSDLLYPVWEQEELADLIPNAELEVVDAPQGHDAFLIELDRLDKRILDWLREIQENEAKWKAA